MRTWARLDLQSERNDRGRYPDGAYIDIEHHLLRLALVSEIAPRANKKYVVATPPPKASLPASAMEPTNAGSAVSPASAAEKKKHAMAVVAAASAAANAASVQQIAGAAGPSGTGSGAGAGPSSDPGAADTGAKDKKGKKFGLFGLSKEKDKDDKKSGKAQKKTMAKGTGYSSCQQKGWDPKAYIAAQKEKDRQIELVLGKIQHELKKLHGSGGQGERGERSNDVLSDGTDDEQTTSVASAASAGSIRTSSNGGSHRSSSRRKRKHSPDEVSGAVAGAAGGAAASDLHHPQDGEASALPIDPQTDLYAVLEGSALIPFLESKLRANSFLEINSHKSVYQCVINIIREICNQPYLVTLLGTLPDQTTSLHSLLQALEKQAKVLLEKIGKASANGSVVKPTSPADDGAPQVQRASAASKIAEKINEKASGDKLARDFLNLSQEVTQALSCVVAGPSSSSSSSVAGALAANADHMSATASGSSSSNPVDLHDVHMEVDGAVGGGASTSGSGSRDSESGEAADGEPVAGPSGMQRKTREDKSAELYKKHMKGLQFDSSDFSLTGNQV